MSDAILHQFFEVLSEMIEIDQVDWQIANRFAMRWKMSVADALLDLNYVDETTLAKALATANNLTYIQGSLLTCDFRETDFDTFDDLLNVGAVPLLEDRLAIFNPYDDLRGNLGARLCDREMVVTERSYVFDALRKQGLTHWLPSDS